MIFFVISSIMNWSHKPLSLYLFLPILRFFFSNASSVRVNDIVLLRLFPSKKSNVPVYYVAEVLSQEPSSNWKIGCMGRYRTQLLSAFVLTQVEDVASYRDTDIMKKITIRNNEKQLPEMLTKT
jgi:hypothetical protein